MSTTNLTQEHEDDMWGDLAAEFQQAKATPAMVNTATPINRRIGPGERVRLSIFSGFLPMLALCLVATGAALPRPYEPLTTGLAGVFAVCLAGLLAPVLGGRRRALWVYALPALLVGLVGELGTTGAEMIETNVSNYRAETLDYINILQDHLERYLTFEHWALYLLAAPAIAWLTFKAASQTPWLDSPRRGKLTKGLAILVLVGPALILVGSLTIGPRLTAETDRWLADVMAAHPGIEFRPVPESRSNNLTPWGKISNEWRTLLPNDRDVRINETPATTVRDIEKKVDALLQVSQQHREELDWSSGWQKQELETLLLLRVEDLAHPVETTQLILEDRLSNRFSGPYRAADTTATAFDVLLGQLANPSVSESHLASANAMARAFQKDLLPTIDELDITAAKNAVTLVDYNGPFGRAENQSRPLSAFGTELVSSPTSLFINFKRAEHLSYWLTYRPILAQVPVHKQTSTLMAHAKATQSKELYSLSEDSVYSDQIRPYLQATELLSALRLSKIQTGNWPTSLDQVEDSLSFAPDPAEWSLTFKDGTVTLESSELKPQPDQRIIRTVKQGRRYQPAATKWVLR